MEIIGFILAYVFVRYVMVAGFVANCIEDENYRTP